MHCPRRTPVKDHDKMISNSFRNQLPAACSAFGKVDRCASSPPRVRGSFTASLRSITECGSKPLLALPSPVLLLSLIRTLLSNTNAPHPTFNLAVLTRGPDDVLVHGLALRVNHPHRLECGVFLTAGARKSAKRAVEVLVLA
eukprot:GHVN01015723.1.p1 GENE.GHVN01015723.1~~GHVN01015723.1.p1  ORF type:complete len:142 (+),score=2.29 GHVN01015723.1:883-1308(+)